MTDDLVERVAQLYEAKWGVKDHWLARAAIAVVLEEAAKVCDAEAERYWDGGHGFRDGTALDCAAAIRALVKEPNDHGPASGSDS